MPRIAEIDAVHQKLLQLNAAELQAEHKERQRIARELHDGLQQHLANVQITVDLARQRADQPPEGEVLLARASQSTKHVIEELHHIVRDLRPPALAQLGLIEALQQLCDEIGTATDLAIELEVIGDKGEKGQALRTLPESLTECAYRVVQECLNNVRKHANASFVHVLIELVDYPAQHLLVQVSDDGVGIEVGERAKPDSFGLTGMRQRVAAHSGGLEISRGHDGDATRGTTVRAVMPIRGNLPLRAG